MKLKLQHISIEETQLTDGKYCMVSREYKRRLPTNKQWAYDLSFVAIVGEDIESGCSFDAGYRTGPDKPGIHTFRQLHESTYATRFKTSW